MGQVDTSQRAGCELCNQEGGLLVVRNAWLRVIRVADADYPGFYRVIWNAHVAEFTDLSAAERRTLMEAVATVETLLRQHLNPLKVNLASLGNMVAHQHWHVIARFADDRQFPQPIWGTPQRDGTSGAARVTAAQLAELDQEIAEALGCASTGS